MREMRTYTREAFASFDRLSEDEQKKWMDRAQRNMNLLLAKMEKGLDSAMKEDQHGS
jgi:hypothetical protein